MVKCFNVVPDITTFTEQKPPFDGDGGGVQENKRKDDSLTQDTGGRAVL